MTALAAERVRRAPITVPDAAAIVVLVAALDLEVPFVLNVNRFDDLDVDIYIPHDDAPREDRVAAVKRVALCAGANALVVRNTVQVTWTTREGRVRVWTDIVSPDPELDATVAADRAYAHWTDAVRDTGAGDDE